MTLSAWFACADDCAGGRDARYPLTDVRYACPACGGLLEVRHDLAALRAHGDAAAWRRRFADRWGDAVVGGPDARAGAGSGVWGKREWVHPGLPDRAIVSLGEGGSHLVRADRYAAALGLGEVYVKQCGTSHSGSFKDLGMTVLVSTVNDLIQRGAPIRAVACASTGDTSAALAAYGAAAGIRTIVILPRGKISTAQLVQPLANGALVLALDTDFDGCMQIVQQLATRDGVYLANSMNSLRVEGQKTVAIELTQQLGWRAPDWVIIPGGNLGNVSALGAGFAMMKDLGLIDRLPRICVAQTAGAAPLVTSYAAGWAPLVPVRAKATLASAIQIGAPVSFGKAVRALRRRATVWRWQRARSSWPMRRRAPTGPACSPARTPAWRWPRSSSSRRVARSPAITAWSWCRPPAASSSPTSRSATTTARSPTCRRRGTPTARSTCRPTTPPCARSRCVRSTRRPPRRFSRRRRRRRSTARASPGPNSAPAGSGTRPHAAARCRPPPARRPRSCQRRSGAASSARARRGPRPRHPRADRRRRCPRVAAGGSSRSWRSWR
jgi:threonine synthase